VPTSAATNVLAPVNTHIQKSSITLPHRLPLSLSTTTASFLSLFRALTVAFHSFPPNHTFCKQFPPRGLSRKCTLFQDHLALPWPLYKQHRSPLKIDKIQPNILHTHSFPGEHTVTLFPKDNERHYCTNRALWPFNFPASSAYHSSTVISALSFIYKGCLPLLSFEKIKAVAEERNNSSSGH
jgi:hypothetical protein